MRSAIRTLGAVVPRLLLLALLAGLYMAGLTVAHVQPPRDAMHIHLLGWIMIGTAILGVVGLGIETVDLHNRRAAQRRAQEAQHAQETGLWLSSCSCACCALSDSQRDSQNDSHGSLVLLAITPDGPSRHQAFQGNQALQANPRGYLPLPDPIRYFD